MDYYKDAFGEFDPQGDHHAAVKFVLNSILMDDRVDELTWLLTDGHEVGGIEGEPGWTVERRDVGLMGDMPGYADWPVGANFRAHVDQDSFDLAYPEEFLTVQEFHKYVRLALGAYLGRNALKVSQINNILSNLIA